MEYYNIRNRDMGRNDVWDMSRDDVWDMSSDDVWDLGSNDVCCGYCGERNSFPLRKVSARQKISTELSAICLLTS
jgi:hypothetical protein